MPKKNAPGCKCCSPGTGIQFVGCLNQTYPNRDIDFFSSIDGSGIPSGLVDTKTTDSSGIIYLPAGNYIVRPAGAVSGRWYGMQVTVGEHDWQPIVPGYLQPMAGYYCWDQCPDPLAETIRWSEPRWGTGTMVYTGAGVGRWEGTTSVPIAACPAIGCLATTKPLDFLLGNGDIATSGFGGFWIFGGWSYPTGTCAGGYSNADGYDYPMLGTRVDGSLFCPPSLSVQYQMVSGPYTPSFRLQQYFCGYTPTFTITE